MSTQNAIPNPEVKVTFWPPLFLQRKMWVLDILRRDKISRILDIGCGEGELLTALCQPAPWLPCNSGNTIAPASTEPNVEETTDLHPRCIIGLDISSRELELAASYCSPAENCSYERWEPLEVQIWHGGLESVNPDFIDVECIVSMEVIEHLPETVLSEFAPIILGVYHPRIFLMTTPSYDFNELFSAPDMPRNDGYRDPTGRTTRIFRHSDHKFEWSVTEFIAWCRNAAEEWGYEVTTGTIGSALERDPWGRDKGLGGASQTAEFRRLDDDATVEMRSRKREDVLRGAAGRPYHGLMATHHYTAHPSAKNPSPCKYIGDLIAASMEEGGDVVIRMEELWFRRDLSVACGGSIEVMMDVVNQHDRLQLRKHEKRSDWEVELMGWIPRTEIPWQRHEDKLVLDDDQCDENIEDEEYERFDSIYESLPPSWATAPDSNDNSPVEQSSGWGDTSEAPSFEHVDTNETWNGWGGPVTGTWGIEVNWNKET